MKHILFFILLFPCLGWFVSGVASTTKLPPIKYPALSASYRANVEAHTQESFKDLRARKECQTDWKDLKRKSSYLYRILAFEALSKCGHPYPEVVMVTSDAHDVYSASAGPVMICAKRGRGINFYEPEYEKEAYGVRRLFMFHEAVHMMKKDYYQSYAHKEESQKREQRADMEGAGLAGCQHCAFEYAEYWLKRFLKNTSFVWHMVKSTGIVPRSIDIIHAWQVGYLDWYMAESKKTLSQAAGVNKSTHPFDLERALYMVKLAKTELQSQACEFHRPVLVRQQKAADYKKKLFEYKRMQEAMQKEKKDFDAKIAHQKKIIATLQAKQRAETLKALRERYPSFISKGRGEWLAKQKK